MNSSLVKKCWQTLFYVCHYFTQKDEDIISLEDDPDLANILENQALSSSLDLDLG